MDMTEAFAKTLKERRRALGYTQRELGERLGYSEKAISKWESGVALPPSAVLLPLADALGVSVDELLSHRGEPTYFLGIDGGATKTDFVLTDREGNVLEHVCLGSSNPVDIGMDAACACLGEGIRQVCRNVPIRHVSVYAGLSGGSVGDNASTIHAYLSGFHFARVGCGNDATNIIAAGLGKQDGVSVIMGTGSVAFVQKNGELGRLGGYGYLFDEGGNGYAIGRDAIAAALHAEEGSGEKTLLRELILARTKTATVLEALSSFYEGGKREIASYAPLVIEAHGKGDRVATAILERNMACLADMIGLARQRLGTAEPTRVVLVGGLTKSADVLLPMMRAHFDRPENYTISIFTEPAVKGALLLAGVPVSETREE